MLLTSTSHHHPHEKPVTALKFAHEADKLSLRRRDSQGSAPNTAVEAKFITSHDLVIETADGGRLPSVPASEAEKLNRLRDEVESGGDVTVRVTTPLLDHNDDHRSRLPNEKLHTLEKQQELPLSKQKLDTAVPPAKTHPLFPPLPLYGPPTLLRSLQCMLFRFCAFFLSLSFLGCVVLGALVDGIRVQFVTIRLRWNGQDPNARRKFYREEQERERARKAAARKWKRQLEKKELEDGHGECSPLEGGKDALVCDVGYYARRVGLDVEEFKVQTEDGFIITLWHVYNPQEYAPLSAEERGPRGPDVFSRDTNPRTFPSTNRRYPVLLMHGLLQSAGAYCTNDDDSLAFYLCKAGYDVWLGNNRCGMHPEHTKLSYSDPRMWAWNIRQLGVLDLAALMSRVLYETGFEKLGLVCHSQGTTQTLVALAKEQRPELGERISIFCALAPAAYAGPLIEKMYFRFMRVISPGMFRIFFGIHAFIPFMMTMHSILHPRLYGTLGYLVFSFLFGWTDDRWDRGLRHRMFQFAPVYVSAEAMRWWLGRECFATQKCILSTREDGQREEEEDRKFETGTDDGRCRGDTAWYGEQAPPMALWIGGSDELVDGRKLLRRLQNGREPCVRVVHAKVIEEYEHLDVLWAMDAIEQVGREVRDVLWMTVAEEVKQKCRRPRGVIISVDR